MARGVAVAGRAVDSTEKRALRNLYLSQWRGHDKLLGCAGLMSVHIGRFGRCGSAPTRHDNNRMRHLRDNQAEHSAVRAQTGPA